MPSSVRGIPCLISSLTVLLFSPLLNCEIRAGSFSFEFFNVSSRGEAGGGGDLQSPYEWGLLSVV